MLSSLFTGWADPYDLARLGLLTGANDAHLAALQAAFRGPTPWLRTYF